MTAQQVEDEQAAVTRRIAARQPWFAVITIGVVLVAAASNAERALFLFRARPQAAQRSLADRLRELLVRQRDHPVVFAAIVCGSLGLVAIAGAFYVYLDVDKRASERALGMLQFCHLALRTQAEQHVLDEQRRNLQAIQATAGDIRVLVGNLPPDQQQKAKLIVSQMNAALERQDRIVGDYAARADEAQKDLSAHTVAMEKGLATVQGDLAELRSLPTSVKDLKSATGRIDRATTVIDGQFDDLRAQILSLEAKVDALLSRPACTVPPVVVAAGAARSAPQDAGTTASSTTPPPHPALVAPLDKHDGGAAHASNP